MARQKQLLPVGRKLTMTCSKECLQMGALIYGFYAAVGVAALYFGYMFFVFSTARAIYQFRVGSDIPDDASMWFWKWQWKPKGRLG